MAGQQFCVKWKINILATFCINFATCEAGCHSVLQAWNVKICQKSQWTRACRTSCHKLAHCEGLATFGNAPKRDYENCCQHGLLFIIIALWWWFCPCRVGGAVWNHTAWLFPLMPLPTLSLFYSYFLSGNKYRKNITCKNIGQFQFCINLLPLELIWRSASCPRHWNQRWFGDAAFTIPSGKQWDHMSPWPPSWLSAGIDECCRSANESGHQWLKNSWLETIWH